MLEKVREKGNPLALLVGMQTSAATMDNIMEISLKKKKKTCHTTQQPHCWAYTLRKTELKGTCVPQCSSKALLTIARTWKQPRCPSADEWIRKFQYICTMEYYSAIKNKAFDLF